MSKKLISLDFKIYSKENFTLSKYKKYYKGLYKIFTITNIYIT